MVSTGSEIELGLSWYCLPPLELSLVEAVLISLLFKTGASRAGTCDVFKTVIEGSSPVIHPPTPPLSFPLFNPASKPPCKSTFSSSFLFRGSDWLTV